MSLLFLFKSRSSVVVPTLGAVRPYLMARALEDVDAGTLRALDVDGTVNPSGGGSLSVTASPTSGVIKPRRGGIPLG